MAYKESDPIKGTRDALYIRDTQVRHRLCVFECGNGDGDSETPLLTLHQYGDAVKTCTVLVVLAVRTLALRYITQLVASCWLFSKLGFEVVASWLLTIFTKGRQ